MEVSKTNQINEGKQGKHHSSTNQLKFKLENKKTRSFNRNFHFFKNHKSQITTKSIQIEVVNDQLSSTTTTTQNSTSTTESAVNPRKRKFVDEQFDQLVLSNQDWMSSKGLRTVCPNCQKTRKYFCYDCLISMEPTLTPKMKLPVLLDMYDYIYFDYDFDFGF